AQRLHQLLPGLVREFLEYNRRATSLVREARFRIRDRLADDAVADAAAQINAVAPRQAWPEVCPQVPGPAAPLESFGAAGQKEKLGHPLLLQLDHPIPGQLDLVLPEPAVAVPASAGNSCGLRFALDADSDRALAGRFDLVRPELTLIERAL